ncbi:hypothetical protein [Pseudomonas japonica]|uniref:hypothetical protein n=1 Tax=Pseudomonas japonica TaxID=256466 RepID=UPI0011303945|nr:hypothetical protein [Pseudomonas japonica]
MDKVDYGSGTPWPGLSAKRQKIHGWLIEIMHQVEILSDNVQHSGGTLTLFFQGANGLDGLLRNS